MSLTFVNGSSPFLNADNLNSIVADIATAAGVPDAALAARINDGASTSNAAVKTVAAGIGGALAIVFGG